jgi:hypothetical protein
MILVFAMFFDMMQLATGKWTDQRSEEDENL